MNDTATNKTAEAKPAAKERDIATRVARACVLRFTAQEHKGKFRDKAALEFVLGAMAAADPESKSFQRLGILAMLVSVRGYAFVKEWAKAHEVEVTIERVDGGKEHAKD